MTGQAPVAKTDLAAALLIAARLVEAYGERFLPVFLRLEAETDMAMRRAAALGRARAVILTQPSKHQQES